MNQLTVRGFDDELNDHLQRLARREGISLNKAALKLLRKGAGLTGDAGDDRTIGSSLDFFIGSCTAAEADELQCALPPRWRNSIPSMSRCGHENTLGCQRVLPA